MGFFTTLLIYAALLALSELLKPKPNVENARPAGLGEFQFPTATEGRFVPIVWGTVRIKGPNVVWYGDLRQEAITEKIKTGLFSSTRVVVGFRYYLGVQFALSRGIDTLRRIWIGEEEVFSGSQATGTLSIDKPELFGGDNLGNGGVTGDLDVEIGDQTTANTYLSDFQDEGGNTPVYKGTAHVILKGMYLGNSTSIKPWAFEVRRIPDNAGALSADQLVNSADANPMAVIYELMTNTEWGFGFPAADIDESNFQTAATTLKTEGNGWSFQLEDGMEALDLLKEVERQIDGVVFLNQSTGKWQVKLARDDYDINLVPQLNETNIKDVRNFTRGAWEETTNQVTVGFVNRDLDYKETFALAQDMANIRIQGGTNVSASPKYPGVKNAALANAIAWRELRTLSYPLAKASFVVDRTFWDITNGQVVAWTDTELGLTKLPMRVVRVDLGQLDSNQIVLDCVQDVFRHAVGSFSDPSATGWTAPADDLDAFPAAEQVIFEAPRAFVRRDPDSEEIVSKIWAGARRQGNEVSFEIRERHDPSSPSGSFGLAGEPFDFVKIGELDSDLGNGSAVPLDNLIITPTDTQAALIAALTGGDIVDVGTNLTFLVMVNNEFMLVTAAAVANAANVELDGVYRGALDSVPESHTAGDEVYILSGATAGGGMTTVVFNGTDLVDVKLIPKSTSDEVAEGDATTVQVDLDRRTERPYPPGVTLLNTSVHPTSVALEGGAGSGLDAEKMDLELRRRDFRVMDEIAALLNDAADLFSDFPTANTTEHQVEVRDDPDGTNTLLYTIDWFSGKTADLERQTILRHTDGVLPTRMRIVVRSRHTINGEVLQSLFDYKFDFDVTTDLTGDFNFGATDKDEVSNSYTVDQAGVHTVDIGTAFTAGAVEYRVNGGAWQNLISAGGTNGSTSSLSLSDTLELRHRSTDTDAETEYKMTAPVGGTDGYGVFFT